MRAALFALAGLAFVPAGAEARSHGCNMPHARVVARNAQVVVVRQSRRYFACTRRGGIRRALDDGAEVTGRFRLAGRFLAYEREDGCYDRCLRIVSLDVRTGRRLVSYSSSAPIRRLVIDTRGRTAWIRDEAVRELRRMDSDGDEAIDAGAGIAPESLAIRAGQIVWQADGQVKTAPLDSHPPCAGRNTSTLERTPEVRIFFKSLSREPVSGSVYGCAVASGRITTMGGASLDTFEYYGGGFVQAAGHFATIDEGAAGRNGARADLSVFNLLTGVRAHRWQCCQGSDFSLEAVVLHPSGAVAWMYLGTPRSGDRSTHAVAKSDAEGEAVVLASTDKWSATDRQTLRLDGDVVSWTLNGVPGSAQLR